MLNSQSDERSDQHTHILRQSLLDNSAATAGTTTASPVLSPLPVPSLLCRPPPSPQFGGAAAGMAPAACQLSSGFHRCVTSV